LKSNPPYKSNGDDIAASRRGIVLVAVVALIAISLTLFGVWAQSAVQQQKRFHLRQYRMQAVRLAEAGVRRAVARRLADVQFESETWRIPDEMLDNSNAAEVRIRVAAAGVSGALIYEATAEFPAGEVRRAQVTRRIETANPTTGDER
jgi:type II secretory pathway pseudopilin PulG